MTGVDGFYDTVNKSVHVYHRTDVYKYSNANHPFLFLILYHIFKIWGAVSDLLRVETDVLFHTLNHKNKREVYKISTIFQNSQEKNDE